MSNMQQDRVDRNYQVFRQTLPRILAGHRGEIALMHDGMIVAYSDTTADAYAAGRLWFGCDGVFSLQEVTDEPVYLGSAGFAVQPALPFRTEPKAGSYDVVRDDAAFGTHIREAIQILKAWWGDTPG